MRPYDTPPILNGTVQQQVQQLREFLMRTVLDMNRRDNIRSEDPSRRDSNAVQQQTPARPGLKLKDVVDKIYPIGSIYISAAGTNPKELFGFGEWTQIKDRFLLAAGDTYSAGLIGGEATHTLTVDEMPKHKHSLVGDSHTYLWGDGVGTVNIANAIAQGGATSQNRLYTMQGEWNETDQSGGNQPLDIMPPFLAVHVWQRTA